LLWENNMANFYKSLFGKKGQKIIQEVIKEATKPLKGEALEKAVMSSRYKLGKKSAGEIGKYLKVRPSVVKKILKKYKVSGRGFARVGVLGTLGAGAAVVAAWAPVAKELGEYLGTKLEKRKIKKQRQRKLLLKKVEEFKKVKHHFPEETQQRIYKDILKKYWK